MSPCIPKGMHDEFIKMRFELVTPDVLQARSSLGFVKDVYDPVVAIREPLSAYQTMLDLIHQDATLATAYDIIVDFTTARGFDFIGGTKDKRDELRILFDNLNFRQVLQNVVYNLCYYGDCFVELRKNESKKINELWVLETTEMRIQYNEHGQVFGYVQRPFSMAGMSEEEILKKESTHGILFPKDDVIHFRMKWIGSQVYSYNPNEPISIVASTRLHAGNYLMNIFINMPPRYVIHLAGVSSKDWLGIKSEFQSTKTNYKRAIAFSRSSDPKSKLEIKEVKPAYDSTLIEIMQWLNKEMLKVTRVPRIWVEGETGENRGIGEAVNLPFQTRIQAIHRNILEPSLNSKLLKQLGYYKLTKGANQYVALRFNEISRKGEKEILENAALLRNMGMKNGALVNYLDKNGILGIDPNDFEKKQVMASDSLFPSRKPMDKEVDDMKTSLDETGVSAAGGQKIEEIKAKV